MHRGGGQVVDKYIVNRPTDTPQVEFAIAEPLGLDVVFLGRQNLNDGVLLSVVRLPHPSIPGESSHGPSRRRRLADDVPA